MPTPKKTLTPEDKIWWEKIYQYIEKEILQYDNNQRLQKGAVLRLKGLQDGKVIANNKTNANGTYPLEVVYSAIVLSKNDFLKVRDYKDFKGEEQALAYFCAIVRNRLNDVYDGWKAKQHEENVIKNISFDEKHKGVAYKAKGRAGINVGRVAEALW